MIDTAHLEMPASASPFVVSAATLARLVEESYYRIFGEKVLFGIRGATLVSGDHGVWQNEVSVVETTLDGEHFRCLLGIWDLKTHKIALFPASTIPHNMWQKKQAEMPDKRIANLLGVGSYRYIVGAHEPEGEGRPFEEGAFRLSRLQPVLAWRFYQADHRFRVEQANACLSVVNDHIHSAQSTSKPTGISFSSAGCQVIEGDHTPPEAPTGFYQTFRILAGQSFQPSELEVGLPYRYLLTSARHLAAISSGTNLPRLMQGSHGFLVRRVQEALMAGGFLDETLIDKGDFNGATALALCHFQQSEELRVDGIVTPEVLRRLKIREGFSHY